MADLLAQLDENAQRKESAPRVRQKKAAALIRGVPGLPCAEDFLIPFMPPPDEELVRRKVTANQMKRGLVADPGGRQIQPDVYITPKMLNTWEADRSMRPVKTYKRYFGENKGDLRGLYRFHVQPEEIPLSKVMGKQHAKWLQEHLKRRDRELYPVYYYKKDIRQEEEKLTKQNDTTSTKGMLISVMLAKPSEKEDSDLTKLFRKTAKKGAHIGSVGGEIDSLKKMKKTRSAPTLDHDIVVDPPKFNYVPRTGRQIGLRYPWQLCEEKLTAGVKIINF